MVKKVVRKGSGNSSKRKKRRRLWFKRIRFLCILMTIGFIIWGIQNCSPKDDSVAEHGKSSVQTMKETAAETKVAPKLNTAKTESLRKELTEYIKKFTGQYGIYYYNLDTHEAIGIGHDKEFTAASTIKVPLNLLLYEKVRAGTTNPDGTLAYLKEDYEGGTGILQNEEFGKKFVIRELSRLSITKSDNIATNMLIRYFGLSNLKAYMRQLGGKIVDETKNTSSPEDMGLYMKTIYEAYQGEEAFGKELMENLLHTDFNDRIPALLPKSVKVAHKIGTQVGVVNDVGIVFAQTPYVIAVMSNGVGEKEGSNVIANISKKIYDFVNTAQ
ncbi:MAG: class A beta-lactamase-related serine hydrolase [Clostridia bacterium]|nr:class A beta-lactamase-related serine hydrolase [Clostridia bacterium]